MKQTVKESISKIVVMGILLLTMATIIIGWLVGYKAFIVNGESMEPIIKYRSLAVVYKIDASDIKLGEAITYKVGSGFVTHRLVEVHDNGTLVAEFRDNSNYQEAWEQGDAYTVDRSDLGHNVVAWYSGVEFNENMLFNTQSTQYSTNPFESDAPLEDVYYENIHGIVMFTIPNFGNVVLFIQNNIILIVATLASIILLFNMLKAEKGKN